MTEPLYTDAGRMDKAARGLSLSMFALMAVGVVLVASASSMEGARAGRPTALLEGHLIRLGLAVAAFLLAQRVSPRALFLSAAPLWLTAVGLLAATLVLGNDSHGARRWIDLGPISFQPSELGRVAAVLAIGAWASLVKDRMGEFRTGVLLPFALAGIPGALTFLEPDFGSSLYLMFLAVVVLWVGGASTLHLMGCFSAVLSVASIWGWERFGHVRERISGFASPDASSQVGQGLTALGAGHVSGRGLAEGYAGWGYVPEAENDFVLTVLGEEFGLIGCLVVMALYGAFLWHGLRLLMGLRSRFALVVGTGLLFQVLIQALLNIAVVTAMAPAKGLPLPFLSAGGTSLLVLAGSTGLLLGLARSPEQDPVIGARWASWLMRRVRGDVGPSLDPEGAA